MNIGHKLWPSLHFQWFLGCHRLVTLGAPHPSPKFFHSRVARRWRKPRWKRSDWRLDPSIYSSNWWFQNAFNDEVTWEKCPCATGAFLFVCFSFYWELFLQFWVHRWNRTFLLILVRGSQEACQGRGGELSAPGGHKKGTETRGSKGGVDLLRSMFQDFCWRRFGCLLRCFGIWNIKEKKMKEGGCPSKKITFSRKKLRRPKQIRDIQTNI